MRLVTCLAIPVAFLPGAATAQPVPASRSGDILLPRSSGPHQEADRIDRDFRWHCRNLRARADIAVTARGFQHVRLFVNGHEIAQSRSGEALRLTRELNALDYVAFYCTQTGGYTFHLVGLATVPDSQNRFIDGNAR